MKKLFIILAVAFVLFLPSMPAAAFSLVDGLNPACLSSGDCTTCDILQVVFNFGKFIFMSTAALALLFGLWQASGMVMNWGNAEAVKMAKDKLLSTLLAVFIILASYTLVGALITTFAGQGNFKSDFFKSGKWWVGPTCETQRPESTFPPRTTGGGTGASGDGCKSAWEAGTKPGCGGNCGSITTSGIRSDQCQDASKDLITLLVCFRAKIAEEKARDASFNFPLSITSISDDNGLSFCRDTSPFPRRCSSSGDTNCCWHTQNSCHYKTDGSHAADFSITNEWGWESIYKSKMKKAAEDCGGNFLDYLDEGSTIKHFHISKGCSGK